MPSDRHKRKEVKMANKVCVITGAGGVLCSSFAKEMAKNGYSVALLDLNLEAAQAVADELVNLGVSRDTVLVWIAKRNMPASKVGRLWKFKVSEVDAWVKAGNAAEK